MTKSCVQKWWMRFRIFFLFKHVLRNNSRMCFRECQRHSTSNCRLWPITFLNSLWFSQGFVFFAFMSSITVCVFRAPLSMFLSVVIHNFAWYIYFLIAWAIFYLIEPEEFVFVYFGLAFTQRMINDAAILWKQRLCLRSWIFDAEKFILGGGNLCEESYHDF